MFVLFSKDEDCLKNNVPRRHAAKRCVLSILHDDLPLPTLTGTFGNNQRLLRLTVNHVICCGRLINGRLSAKSTIYGCRAIANSLFSTGVAYAFKHPSLIDLPVRYVRRWADDQMDLYLRAKRDARHDDLHKSRTRCISFTYHSRCFSDSLRWRRNFWLNECHGLGRWHQYRRHGRDWYLYPLMGPGR